MLRRAATTLVLVVMTLTLAGCGSLRLETDDPAPSSAGPHEQARQAHAEQAWALAELAHAAAATDPELGPLLEAIAADARTQLDALGGVWRSSGRHLEPAAPVGDATDVVDALRTAAADALASAIGSEGDVAQMFAGIAISRSLRADQLAVALGSQPDAVEPALPAELASATVTDLVRTLDALGQAWEIVAARAEDPAAARGEADRWRGLAQQVAALAGVADTAEDPRAVSYDLDTDDLSATIADLEADLVPCWLAQLASTTGDDRRAVIDLALAAARDAGLAALDAEIPAIMGHG